jgi:hypothetical protein
MEWVLGDDEILDMVARFHDKGSRCAVVVWLEDGEVVDARISDAVALEGEFGMPRVRNTIASYDPERSVCVVVVRDNRDTVILAGEVD